MDLIETPDGLALRVLVRAAPTNGAANKAVIGVIAKALARAKSTITLASGAKGRNKTLALDPLPGTIEALDALISSAVGRATPAPAPPTAARKS